MYTSGNSKLAEIHRYFNTKCNYTSQNEHKLHLASASIDMCRSMIQIQNICKLAAFYGWESFMWMNVKVVFVLCTFPSGLACGPYVRSVSTHINRDCFGFWKNFKKHPVWRNPVDTLRESQPGCDVATALFARERKQQQPTVRSIVLTCLPTSFNK